jgi:hypothetical protein
MTTARQIRRAKLDLFAIHDHVRLLASQAIVAGMEPEEVWLGPPQAEAVLRGLESDPGFYGRSNRQRPEDLEGGKLGGLVVRLSKTPGIRVGKTFA